jgi:hypothetical protein
VGIGYIVGIEVGVVVIRARVRAVVGGGGGGVVGY